MQYVQLDFTALRVSPNDDYVNIYDGDSDLAPLIARISGFYTYPPHFITTQRYMFITFVSDEAVSEEGFSANFHSPVQPC